MKKISLIAVALTCATLLAAGTAAAQTQTDPPQRTPVAGFSPNFADPQPITAATLTEEANRLIRWKGWLDVDAFSASILAQMQKQLASGTLELGKFTLEEPSIAEAVDKAESLRNFDMNKNLLTGESFRPDANLPAFYVWTYRHNFADTGLYQLYISVKGRMLIGTTTDPEDDPDPLPVRHRDIQSLGYEFGTDPATGKPIDGVGRVRVREHFDDVEIWRGAVVRVNARGVLEFVGNEAGVVVGPLKDEPVERVPVALWEKAPSLKDNPNYVPTRATGAAYIEPLERTIGIHENEVQKATGTVPKPTGDLRKDVQEQGRVTTVPLRATTNPTGFWFRGR